MVSGIYWGKIIGIAKKRMRSYFGKGKKINLIIFITKINPHVASQYPA
jgi:hypothetical protein